MSFNRKRPVISMIAAVDDRWNLAVDGRLPWKRQLADKNYYLQKVAGHTIIMGSTTYAAADHSRKGNRIVVISRRSFKEFNLLEEDVIDSIEAILTVEPQTEENEIFITGGGSIYTAAEKEIADRIYLNIIYTDSSKTGKEIKFPDLDNNKWKLVGSEKIAADQDNEFPAKFMIYERIN
ncbi:MAG: dihydrofolate reductase [Spirochaetales bacterium]|nr:dihydrofolate reductase [Spirochaetales bacterium]